MTALLRCDCCTAHVLQDMTTRLWDLRYPAAAFAVLKAHIGAIRSLRFRCCSTASQGWRCCCPLLLLALLRWRVPGLPACLPTPECVPPPAGIDGSCCRPCCCCCSPDGRFLAAAEPADYVTLYDAATG